MLRLFLVLLPLVAACAWYFGFNYKRSEDASPEDSESIIPEDYYLGINFLINEEPDKAVDVFIRMLEVNSDTVETHMALGNLFRKKGEVDRAIRVHQNIIARPKLAKGQRTQALSELAQDYLCAGFLDRSERIFLELIDLNDKTITNFTHLLNIYEQQKNWHQAIEIAKKLEVATKDKLWTPISYYYCELADASWHHGQIEQTYKYLKQALICDKNCVRASIMLGKLEAEKEDYKSAIRTFKKVKEQDPIYLSEVIKPLGECYQKINSEKEFIQYLKDCLVGLPQIPLILTLLQHIKKEEGVASALEFMQTQLAKRVFLRGLPPLIDLYLTETSDKPELQTPFLQLQKNIEKILENKPIYRCVNCGFSGKQLYWQCPGCRKWAVVKPINDIN